MRSNIILLLFFVPSVLWAFEISQLINEPLSLQASIKSQNFHKTIQQLRELNIDIAGVDRKNSIIDVLLTDSQWTQLKKLGLPLETHWALGVSISERVDSGYQTPQEIELFLREMENSFPHLTQLVEIGQSVEGRSIWAIKISDNAKTEEPKEPSILFNSMHHAREIMTPEIAIDIVEYLLSNYDSDLKVKNWVDSNEIWVVPMLNVDGNAKVWDGDTMWRKNTRDTYGVDINRNYPFGWNSCNGSSGFPFAQDYRGKAAASEPETRALMGLVEKIKPVFDISYHTYSELVLYPYGCKNTKGLSQQVMVNIGQEMGQLLGYEAGTPWELLYEADGGDMDWMSAEHQVIAYAIEANSRTEGFNPPYATTRNKTVQLNRKAWQHLLDKLDGPGVRGYIENFLGDEFVEVYQDTKLIQKYRINESGSFHIVLNPGVYLIKSNFFAPQEIEVKNQRIDLN